MVRCHPKEEFRASKVEICGGEYVIHDFKIHVESG